MRAILLFSLFMFLVGNVFAHPPKKIILNTDLKNKSLKVNIAHPVKDTETHFIEKVVITINGKIFEEKTFTKQSTAGNEMIMMTIEDMNEGDKIEVECRCNKLGTAKQSVEVKSYYTQSK